MRFPIQVIYFALPVHVLAAQSFRVVDSNVELIRHLRSMPGLFSVEFSATPCAESHVFGADWCYSIVGSGFGRAIDGLGNGGYLRTHHTASLVEQRIADVDSIGAFDIVWLDAVVSTGPESGAWTSTLTLTNVTTVPLAVRLYAFSNPDLNDMGSGEFGDYTLPCSTPGRILVGDEEDCGGFVSIEAVDSSSFQIGAPVDVATTITSGDPLSDSTLPFGAVESPVDVAVAFAWEATLAPSESLTGIVIVESVRRGVAGDVVHVGLSGGGAATPTLDCVGLPRIGRTLPLVVGTDGDRSGVMLFSLTSTPTQVSALGLAIIADPIVAAVAFVAVAGNACYVVSLGCDAALIGASIAAQALVDDPSSPADLPLSHSDIVVTTIGD
ncbi:MAG: hypothetical protein KDB80_10695 [Planctomycetes bacterium]|nr:hypothetical protein [Planctomycetota bacterium]